MAIEFVGKVTGTATSASSITLDLTALTGGVSSSVATGDMIIVPSGWASTGDESPAVTSSGYIFVTELRGSDTRDANLGVYYKVAGSTPDTFVVTNTRAHTSYGSVAVAYVWRGGRPWIPFDFTTTVGTNSALANSPSIITPEDGCLVIAIGLGSGDTTPNDMVEPSGYSNVAQVKQAGTDSSAILLVASKTAATAGAEDPGAWTSGESTSSDSWCAVSLYLIPGALTGYVDQASIAALTGVGNFIDQASVAVLYGYYSATNYPRTPIVNT
jgi:hypothetical protein